MQMPDLPDSYPRSLTRPSVNVFACTGLFASLVAPFGGFFASGIKRAYNLDDFASVIPGHGGVYDRVDCQLIMGLATQTYYATFIRGACTALRRLGNMQSASVQCLPLLCFSGSFLSAKIIVQLALTLPDEEKRLAYDQLGMVLKEQGILSTRSSFW